MVRQKEGRANSALPFVHFDKSLMAHFISPEFEGTHF